MSLRQARRDDNEAIGDSNMPDGDDNDGAEQEAPVANIEHVGENASGDEGGVEREEEDEKEKDEDDAKATGRVQAAEYEEAEPDVEDEEAMFADGTGEAEEVDMLDEEDEAEGREEAAAG